MYEDEEFEFLLENPKTARRRHFDRENGVLAPFIQYRWLTVYFVLLHLILATLIGSNVLSFLQATWDSKPFIICKTGSTPAYVPSLTTLVPELRALRHVVTKHHATNHSAYTQFSGPPNAANAAAWEHLLKRTHSLALC